ncbi:MAG: type III pantothenate kinase [Bacilli bacterium]|jgi:type III pantothenate kinase
MVLTVDCGNTLIKLGLFDGDSLCNVFKINTNRNRSSDEYAKEMKDLIKVDSLDGAIVSSVVPLLTHELVSAIKRAFKVNPLVVNKELKTKLPIKIDNPSELGSDLLCGAVGALKKYKCPLVIADLGTATKMFVIDKNGNMIGGMISSGMKINLEGLVHNTAQLMETPLEKPKRIISKNTKECIQSGIVYGQAFMVSEFARRMEQEIGYELGRVLTGGFSEVIKDQIVCFHYEPNLTLEGLFEIYKMNR